MGLEDWEYDIHFRSIEYVGDDPVGMEELKNRVWNPAHHWAAERYGLLYDERGRIDCVGEIDEVDTDILNWEVKTRHSGGDWLLRRKQHGQMEYAGYGYIFVTLGFSNMIGFNAKWSVSDIVFVRAGDVDVGKWCRNPVRRYKQSWVGEENFSRVLRVQ